MFEWVWPFSVQFLHYKILKVLQQQQQLDAFHAKTVDTKAVCFYFMKNSTTNV